MVEASETIPQLIALWNQIPEEYRSDFTLCFDIIRESMGVDWLRKHFDPDQKETGVFKISYGTTEEEATRNYRVIDLAECLINLKDVEGIQECLSRMREAENPEASYAELYQLRLITSLLADMATSGRACCRGSCLAAGRGQRSGR